MTCEAIINRHCAMAGTSALVATWKLTLSIEVTAFAG